MVDQEEIENRVAVLVYLPEEISSIIKKVKEKTETFYPNHETHTPHITLYSCRFDLKDLPDLVQKIRDFKIKSFRVTLGEPEFTRLNKGSENLFAAVGFKNESDLYELHEKVLSVANKLRGDLIRTKDIERFRKGVYSQEQFHFIEKYGYEHVMENFHPHITIGEIEKNDIQKVDKIK